MFIQQGSIPKQEAYERLQKSLKEAQELARYLSLADWSSNTYKWANIKESINHIERTVDFMKLGEHK